MRSCNNAQNGKMADPFHDLSKRDSDMKSNFVIKTVIELGYCRTDGLFNIIMHKAFARNQREKEQLLIEYRETKTKQITYCNKTSQPRISNRSKTKAKTI